MNGCRTCVHNQERREGCFQPDLYDLDNEANAEHGTSAEKGEEIHAWRDGASAYDGLDVIGHDEDCPGWEADLPNDETPEAP